MRNEAGLIPTGTRVIIGPQRVETKTASGIVLVDETISAEERAATRGIIIDASDDAWAQKEMKGLKVGDFILFAKYAGDSFNFTRKGVAYRVIDARDVLGKIEADLDSKFQAARTPAEAGGIAEIVPA